ncbi:uncharacterized protein PV09_06553 [Verruconis gallopava]|uniref:Autophagy-related protein 33 n=1 Tax=Verruconis gallopava TaxID=253628 RepID=A0A0D1YMT6_9PEZI|nr:uncharacterized protein PV09_06553 [Verruconis gallopava]KIW02052.1 hypothetical protein PV09_06553 [Verruconis gallopava]
MRLPVITVSKFVGTVSLGLLTGVSYTLSSLALPSLLFLPTAPAAAQTHAYLKQRARRTQKVLSALAISTLSFAYLLSPSRVKHPYLLWTSLVCGAGLSPVLHRIVGRYLGSEDVAARGRIEMEESGVIVTPPASGSSESGDEDASVNGEVVRRGVERGRVVEAARAGVFGLSFVMAVVGLWGDGA